MEFLCQSATRYLSSERSDFPHLASHVEMLNSKCNFAFLQSFFNYSNYYAWKMSSNYPGIKLEPALEHLSSYTHVFHTTAKQVISRRRKNENVFKMAKNACAKRAKILFCIVKYANFWGFCCQIFGDKLTWPCIQIETLVLLASKLHMKSNVVKQCIWKNSTWCFVYMHTFSLRSLAICIVF